MVAVTCASFNVMSLDAPSLPHAPGLKHMGVASCASSVCHGKNSVDLTKNVHMNEYRTWLKQDYHARSYKTLLTRQSKDIATKLGLANAHTADICLDCHADNVSESQRGFKFQISDGVGCEACHGGGEQYLKSHTQTDVTHADNLARGMYPTEQPVPRATLCLSCHLGTNDKFASHHLMGAGHPRLSFELETFTVNQPAHYSNDQDYEHRKGQITSTQMWLTGIFVTASETLNLIDRKLETNSPMPEFALYECHSCHHSMNALGWKVGSYQTPAGSLRLNDSSVLLLESILSVLDKDKSAQLKRQLVRLHQLSGQDISKTRQEAVKFKALITQWRQSILTQQLSNPQKYQLLNALLVNGSNHRFSDFTSAELVFLGIETLMIDLKISQRYGVLLDALFKTVENENRYQLSAFDVAAKKLRRAVNQRSSN